ncbi:MAG TPA: DinB family protein [Hanamia sp.]
MKIIPLLLKELDQESATTRKFLSLVPADKLDWQPHPKSMTMKRLATHIAELPSWIDISINTDGINFAGSPYNPPPVNNSKDLLDLFEKSLAKGKAALENANEEELPKKWTLSNGETVLSVMTKYEAVRHAFSQTIHHRAQLGVFLRLLDIPIPGSYGPSADDQNF